MKPNKSEQITSFEFCNKEIKTFKEDLLCQQDSAHKSMVDNPLGFIIFYVLAILFIASCDLGSSSIALLKQSKAFSLL